MVLKILQNIAAIGTIGTGFFALLKPKSAQGFTGLQLPGARGVTEMRSIMGGLFIALGATPIIFQSEAMFLMLGIAYLAIGAVRAVSMFVDGSLEPSNYISLAAEIVFGIILVL